MVDLLRSWCAGLDDGSGCPVVCATVCSTRVGSVGAGSGFREEGELAGAGSVFWLESSGGRHPGFFCLPPCPEFALDVVATCSLVKSTGDAELSGCSSAAIDLWSTPSRTCSYQDTDGYEPVEDLAYSSGGITGCSSCTDRGCWLTV